MKKIAYSYIRFSREHQAAGDSLRRQLAATRTYCERESLELDESLQLHDLGVSGFKGKNLTKGALGRFIEACESGMIRPGSALVLESLDRLSRQTPRKVVTLLSRLLDDFGIEVHLTSIGKVFRPDNPKDEGIDLILAVALAMRANEESEMKSKRLLQAWSQKRLRATDRGELLHSKVPWWLTIEGKKIVSPPDRASVVREIYRHAASGLSSGQIARCLNREQRPTWRTQGAWSSSRVRDLIRSRRTEGYLTPTDKILKQGRLYEIPNYYPVVVDAGIAAAARLTLKRFTNSDRGRHSQSDRPMNLLRGLLYYGERKMRFELERNGARDASGQKRWNGYYECYDERLDAKKGKLLFMISARQLEPVLFTGLSELSAEDLAPPISEGDRERIAAIWRELAELEQKQTRFLAAVEAGSDGAAERLVAVEKAIRQRRADVAAHEEEIYHGRADSVKLPEWTTAFYDPEIRLKAAGGIRRMVERIQVAESIDELGLSDAVLVQYARDRDRILSGTKVLDDPVVADGRRRTLFVLVTFVTGAIRLIFRADRTSNRIGTWRVDTVASAQDAGANAEATEDVNSRVDPILPSAAI